LIAQKWTALDTNYGALWLICKNLHLWQPASSSTADPTNGQHAAAPTSSSVLENARAIVKDELEHFSSLYIHAILRSWCRNPDPQPEASSSEPASRSHNARWLRDADQACRTVSFEATRLTAEQTWRMQGLTSVARLYPNVQYLTNELKFAVLFGAEPLFT